MEATGCYLAFGLFLGVIIGALFAEGNARRRSALRKVQVLESEKAKAGELIKKARARRQEGVNELPGAYLLMFLAFIMLLLTAYVLATAGIAVF